MQGLRTEKFSESERERVFREINLEVAKFFVILEQSLAIEVIRTFENGIEKETKAIVK